MVVSERVLRGMMNLPKERCAYCGKKEDLGQLCEFCLGLFCPEHGFGSSQRCSLKQLEDKHYQAAGRACFMSSHSTENVVAECGGFAVECRLSSPESRAIKAGRRSRKGVRIVLMVVGRGATPILPVNTAHAEQPVGDRPLHDKGYSVFVPYCEDIVGRWNRDHWN